MHTASRTVNIHPRVINIQETLDQILFTPAIINLGIDVLVDTVAPNERDAPLSFPLSFSLTFSLFLSTYDFVMGSLNILIFLPLSRILRK